MLVLGIAQLPALLVTLPAIGYIWSSGDYGNVEAILLSVLLFIAGAADNILKPLLLGRGVDAGDTDRRTGWHGRQGYLGMFVGAILLALGYQIFMAWVHANPDAATGSVPKDTPLQARPMLHPCSRPVPAEAAAGLSRCSWPRRNSQPLTFWQTVKWR